MVQYKGDINDSLLGLILTDDECEYPLTVDLARGELQVLHEKRKLEQFDPANPLNLHVFIDHSVVEVFVNERESLAATECRIIYLTLYWNINLHF